MDPSYNNSFGTQPNLPSQPIISSGSGDIVLSPTTPKKSKKPLIITVLIILLSAVIGLGVWWYSSSPAKNEHTSEQIPAEITTKQAFNIYANHLVYGTKNSDKDFDLDAMFEDYSLDRPEIYIENADLAEIEAINEAFLVFSDLYNMPATVEDLSVYFYDYEKAKLSGNLDLTDDEILILRENAMTTFAEIYFDVYGIDITIESEAAA